MQTRRNIIAPEKLPTRTVGSPRGSPRRWRAVAPLPPASQDADAETTRMKYQQHWFERDHAIRCRRRRSWHWPVLVASTSYGADAAGGAGMLVSAMGAVSIFFSMTTKYRVGRNRR